MEWQDISTAPTDGTPLLLFARHINASAHVRVVGHYPGHDWGWLAISFVPHGPMQIIPSHWMPLPPPPHKQGEG